jgi:hypothetical protein
MMYRGRAVGVLCSLLMACGASGGAVGQDAGNDTGAALDTGVAPVDVGMPTEAAVDVPAARDTSVAVDAGPPDTGVDAGPLFEDGGTLGEPAWAPLDVRTTTSCPPLAACGGAVESTWDVGGGCFDLPVPAELMQCPGASVTGAEGRARGRVTFAGGIARRAAEWEVQATVMVPAVCAGFLGGCGGLEATVRGFIPDTRCTMESGTGACRCVARQRGQLRDGDGYTTTATQIVSATLNKRWDYCVAGETLRYRDVSEGGAREPGTIELRRR